MIDRRADFGPFDGSWLNCAHQGPLPRKASDAALEALEWKTTPSRLGDGLFDEVPRRLRGALARLVRGSPEQIVLGNSTTFGLQTVASGIPWEPGDEVLVVSGDFPASILPWIGLARRGVATRFIEPAASLPTPAELRAAVGDRTRVVCLSWVNSFTGEVADLEGLGRVCDEVGAWLVVNGSQAVGAIPLDVGTLGVGAISSCGFKWLCGPYGTGFCWIRDDLLAVLEPQSSYWLTLQRGTPLESMRRTSYDAPSGLAASAFDVFGTANFLNFVPWLASIEYLLELGSGAVSEQDRLLHVRYLERIDREAFDLLGSDGGWSPLWVLSHRDRANNAALVDALRRAGIHVALREGNIRLSPHLYNTPAEIDAAVDVLNGSV